MVNFFVLRRLALLGDCPRPKKIRRSCLPIFLDGQRKGLSKTFIVNQVRVGVGVTLLLLQSYFNLFTVFHFAKIDTMEMMCFLMVNG
jgi:hypothetical protein